MYLSIHKRALKIGFPDKTYRDALLVQVIFTNMVSPSQKLHGLVLPKKNVFIQVTYVSVINTLTTPKCCTKRFVSVQFVPKALQLYDKKQFKSEINEVLFLIIGIFFMKVY